MSAPSPTRTHALNGERARYYRELVFDCAERTFAERDFAQARMEEIASAAGISLRTLYLAYPGKQELYAAIDETRVGTMLAAGREAMRAAGTPLERLRRVVASYVSFLASHQHYLLMHLRQGNLWALELDPPHGAPELRWAEAISGLTRLFREGITQGEFYPGDPALMARMMLGVQQIQLADWARRASPGDAASLTAEILDQIERSFCLAESRITPAASPQHSGGADSARDRA